MAQVRDIDLAIGVVTLNNDLVLLIIPAGTIVDVGTELIHFLLGHEAELLFSIRNKALTSSVQIRVAQLGSLVLVGVTLDDARILLEPLREVVVGAASFLSRRRSAFGESVRGVLGIEVTVLRPVVDG